MYVHVYIYVMYMFHIAFWHYFC